MTSIFIVVMWTVAYALLIALAVHKTAPASQRTKKEFFGFAALSFFVLALYIVFLLSFFYLTSWSSPPI